MKTKKLIKTLEDARFAATFERAGFSFPRSSDVLATFNDGSPVTESRVNEFIKERTDLYMRSWVIGPIDQAIQIAKEDTR